MEKRTPEELVGLAREIRRRVEESLRAKKSGGAAEGRPSAENRPFARPSAEDRPFAGTLYYGYVFTDVAEVAAEELLGIKLIIHVIVISHGSGTGSGESLFRLEQTVVI